MSNESTPTPLQEKGNRGREALKARDRMAKNIEILSQTIHRSGYGFARDALGKAKLDPNGVCRVPNQTRRPYSALTALPCNYFGLTWGDISTDSFLIGQNFAPGWNVSGLQPDPDRSVGAAFEDGLPDAPVQKELISSLPDEAGTESRVLS